MEAESKIHPLAIVHENAKIGKNVEIGPFAVKIGRASCRERV